MTRTDYPEKRQMMWFQRIRRALTRENIAHVTYVTLKWGNDHVPFGLRSVLGVVFVIGGILGILPIVGFWMLPLGVALIALDLPWTRHKVHDWMEKLKATAESARTTSGAGQDSATRSQ
ncbi:MAG: hypothetical protein OXH68_03520 [Gammaproteobacteria bacterium]|nr:hypothetical protein [Gammaproteobacteria bacterium]